MSKRLLLQNMLSYFTPDKSRDFGNIICNKSEELFLMTDDDFYFSDTVDAITSYFEKGHSLVILEGHSGSGKSRILRKFAYNMKSTCDAVVFIRYNSYLHRLFPCGKNTVFDKCIFGLFTDKEFYTQKYSLSLFNRKSTKELFYSLAERNPYVIIDGFYDKEIPDEIYSIVKAGFKVLISVRQLPENLSENALVIHHTFCESDIKKSLFSEKNGSCDDVKQLCEIFSYRPSALFMAEKYMSVFSVTPSQLSGLLLELSEERQLNISDDYTKLLYFSTNLSHAEKEMLRTLTVLYLYFIDSIDEANNEDICLTVDTAIEITGKPLSDWKRLSDLGYIRILDDGQIYIENFICEFVMDFLKPSCLNCACLMNYIHNCYKEGFLQAGKDLHGLLYIEKDFSFLKPKYTKNLLDVYGYFSESDPHLSENLYNLLFDYVINNLGFDCSARYTHHLMCISKSHLITMLCDILSSGALYSIYQHEEEIDYKTPLHTNEICAIFDILRICMGFLKFSTYENVHENEPVFRCVTKAFDRVIEIVEKSSQEDIYKLEVYTDTIRLCEEMFIYFSDFSHDGTYYSSRCRKDTSAGFFVNFNFNKSNACSIYPLQSIYTFKMFASFQKLTLYFLNLSKYVKIPKHHIYYHTFYNSKREFYAEMSLLYNRIINGYNSFFDFYERKNRATNVFDMLKDISDKELDKLLEKARNHHEGLLDGSTKKEQRKYADTIIDVTSKSNNPFLLASLILDNDFPVSQNCRNMLHESGFEKALLENKNISNAQHVYLYQKCAKELTENNCHIPIAGTIMDEIKGMKSNIPNPSSTVTAIISYAYLKDVCRTLEVLFYKNLHLDSKSIANHIFDLKAESIFKNHTCTKLVHPSSDYTVANAFYLLKKGQKHSISKSSLKDALETVIYTKFHIDKELSREGFAVLADLLCDKNDVVHLINEMVEYDVLKVITKNKFSNIKKYISEKESE